MLTESLAAKIAATLRDRRTDIVTCSSPATFARETSPLNLQTRKILANSRHESSKPTPATASHPLERLAQLMHSNERLMDDLSSSRLRISDARSYLDGPGCNVRFGEAHLERCRAKHSGILAQLRANRIEALQLLGEGGSGV